MLRDADSRDACAGLRQDVDGRQHQVFDIRIGIVEAFFQNADAESGDAVVQSTQHVHVLRHEARLAWIVRVVASRGLERRGRVLDRARHRTGVVDALVGAETNAKVRHQPEGRLESERAAERRRDTDRATLIATERDVHLAGGHRGARARGRPPVTCA